MRNWRELRAAGSCLTTASSRRRNAERLMPGVRAWLEESPRIWKPRSRPGRLPFRKEIFERED